MQHPSHDPSVGSAHPGSISSSLLQRVKAHEADGWERLVALYAPLVYSWCRRANLGPEDAADVVQEVFEALSRGIEAFRHDQPGSTFRGWVRTITRNKIRDHFRHEDRRPTALGGSDAQRRLTEVTANNSGPGDHDLVSELFRQTLDVIRAEFEDRTWQAFWLAVVEDRPPAEIAETLGMSRGAVAQAKYRVLRRLRQEMGDVQ